jgi:NAD(P)-dependent dehydrogenase (short-subunit alcohol dehydrogenase family)
VKPGFDLTGRRVLVVGGGSPRWSGEGPVNNGGSIACLAGNSGAAVAVADRDEDAAGRVADRIESAGGKAFPVVADVSDPPQCDRLVDEAAERLGGIDGLVLNVGIGAGVGLAGTTADMWDRVLGVNLRSHFLVVKRSMPMMQSGGSIVFMSSAAALRPGTNSRSYDASKAALLGFSRHVAMEGAPQGVRSNVVAPGLIDTPMGREASRATRAATGSGSRSAGRERLRRWLTRSCSSCPMRRAT